MTVNKAMSDKERAEFKKDIELSIVKKWWPVIVFMVGFGLFIVKSTHWFDSNVATKSDIKTLEDKLDKMNETVSAYVSLNDGQHAELRASVKDNKRSIDSLGGALTSVKKSIRSGFVTVSFPNGRNHQPKVTPVY